MPEERPSLEEELKKLGNEFLSSGDSSEEFALVVGKSDGVYILLPYKKKLIQIAKRDISGFPPYKKISSDRIFSPSEKICIHNGVLFDAVLGGTIFNTIENPVFKRPGNPLAEEIRRRKEEERKKMQKKGFFSSIFGSKEEPAQKDKSKLAGREGNIAGLRSINGKLYDFGAFASGTKVYAIFDTLTCPTGKELPVAIRDNPIVNVYGLENYVFDLSSNGLLFETYKCPTGKEKAIYIDGLEVKDVYVHNGKIYLAGYLTQKESAPPRSPPLPGQNRVIAVGELEEILNSRRFIKQIKAGGFLPWPGAGKLKLLTHKGKLFVYADNMVLDCFSEESIPLEKLENLNYKMSYLAAKVIGAVPIGKELYQRVIEDKQVFDKVARPSMLAEAKNKIEDLYEQAEHQFQKQLPSLRENRRAANKFFRGLKEIRRKVAAEYAEFGIKEKEIQQGPIENKFDIYEKMVLG